MNAPAIRDGVETTRPICEHALSVRVIALMASMEEPA